MFYLKFIYIFHCVKNVSFHILIKIIFVILMSPNESTDDDNICKANIQEDLISECAISVTKI